ncbi:MAG: bifunctional phosphopantothenoylcysteine decarboxylase/phosphopantothenate--cysteine ligase CoaBC [Gemmatimonadetes bacterium]|nr:MAG: bifunctional phosphopantothenoylcysteine decarboxylase/phosphopantothenate--cysteine ligase CoaBC [Gemmatimonadota bacterium]PYO66186.1 MAG: bifunctional phosphopantothenoylcysteine decarboxylase/phosphopantothenate--cysteine ligase CoaBC [Gemmatimonadota bacterium]PYO86290.1 MAG: bifunctional phosphopantothenoylcysteine decarboxylase/phosphopantothenate--cysteine ligase CoaBC [Gemmatimonadota bacterium]PYP62168.1 MAG: bifunctional phosphopantothenoylcysteine decarboxylase/phosphopantoth
MMPLAGRHVVLGVSGGIASYKSCVLARRLTEARAAVDVVLTAAASEFVRPVVFEALTGRPVLTSLWQPERALAHIALAKTPDLVILAPATANLLARAAMGLADDLLAALLLARTGPVLCAPAMNDAMWAHPATQANVKTLGKRGWQFIGPEAGPLAEGPSERPGRMSEPEAILAAAERLLAGQGGGRWAGRKVVVTAGPTREHMDPVRVITNPSSGRMGYALAEAALARGADVVLITGPTELPLPAGAAAVRVETTAEMQRAVQAVLKDAQALFMAAAPADFRPASTADRKRARSDGHLTLELEATPDIIATLQRPKTCLMVGFALETGDGLARAREKLQTKRLDFVVLNDALEPGAGFEVTTNKVTIVSKAGEPVILPLLPKRDVADRILDLVESALT